MVALPLNADASTAEVAGPAHRRLLSALGVSAALHAVLAISLGHLPAFGTERMQPPHPLTVTLAPADSRPVTQNTTSKRIEPRTHAAAPMPERKPAAALPSAKYYFRSREVDAPAEAINDVLLRYPQHAFAQGIGGEVRLRVLINDNGFVDEVRVVHASPEDVFDSAARAAAIQLRYLPAVKDGRAVNSQKTIAIVFDPTTAPLE